SFLPTMPMATRSLSWPRRPSPTPWAGWDITRCSKSSAKAAWASCCELITDFGLARAVADASLTQSGVVAGTPMYMAPEQTVGDSIDHRAALFSLGSVFYTMASGRPPFRATTSMATLKRVAEDTPRPIREIIPEVPEWLCNIIAKLHA